MLTIMILYTISSPWILSQPIVEDDRASTSKEQIQSRASPHPGDRTD
jgi:hypothetical protein